MDATWAVPLKGALMQLRWNRFVRAPPPSGTSHSVNWGDDRVRLDIGSSQREQLGTTENVWSGIWTGIDSSIKSSTSVHST